MFCGAGLYARVSADDQQTLAMQNWAMREYTESTRLTIVRHPERNVGGACGLFPLDLF